MENINGKPAIELKETRKKGGFLYEAIKDGNVIATRNSVRPYVAALVVEGNKKIVSGVGRMDLLNGAMKGRHVDYVALLKS